MGQLDVIVTTYEKERSIAECLSRLTSALDVRGYSFRIFVADDASSDNTVRVAQSVADKRIAVLTSTHNQGKGAQIKRTLNFADANIVAIFDGDLDIHPKSLLDAIDTLVSQDCDGVVGSKPHRDSEITYPFSRKVMSRGFRTLSRLMFGLNVRDTQTGLKVFRGEVLRQTAPEVVEDGFLFDLELLARLSHRGLSVAEVPVAINFDFSSTISIGAVAKMMFDMLRVKQTLRRSEFGKLQRIQPSERT
jgi:glycosyltransferase involved in cell wall biosynthesis